MGAPGLARADWDVGDPALWVQLPDLTNNGVAVKGYLADDFQCTEAAPITGIHIWGSFSDDVLPTDLSFGLQIYSNNPGGSYSTPGTTVEWGNDFGPGTFSARPVVYVQEYFWDPAHPKEVSDGEYVMYQFNFSIDPAEAFVPQADTIYWLILAANSTTFGWKTCNPANDDLLADAVWYYPGTGDEDPGHWEQLVYFSGHPYDKYGGMNMAFVLTPIPGAFWLLGSGLLGLGLLGRWRKGDE